MTTTEGFQAYLNACQLRVNQALDLLLPLKTPPAERLKSAMRYGVENGGKRVRATLVYASAEAIGCCSDDTCPQRTALDAVAAALECMHAYSLIHDDLPAMDNDVLRRGKPTCHIAYDEASAILAGDALQTLAFQLLAEAPLSDDIRLALITTLAYASGHKGMVGGQSLDLEGENHRLSIDNLELVHSLKTGALIRASVRMGALVAKASATQLTKLDDYAKAIGLAFQVVDDILDIEGDTATLGKTAGADQALHKSTYPSLLGLEGARDKSKSLLTDALSSLHDFGTSATRLRQMSLYIVERNR